MRASGGCPHCLSCLPAPTTGQGRATQEVLEGGLRNKGKRETAENAKMGFHKPPL